MICPFLGRPVSGARTFSVLVVDLARPDRRPDGPVTTHVDDRGSRPDGVARPLVDRPEVPARRDLTLRTQDRDDHGVRGARQAQQRTGLLDEGLPRAGPAADRVRSDHRLPHLVPGQDVDGREALDADLAQEQAPDGIQTRSLRSSDHSSRGGPVKGSTPPSLATSRDAVRRSSISPPIASPPTTRARTPAAAVHGFQRIARPPDGASPTPEAGSPRRLGATSAPSPAPLPTSPAGGEPSTAAASAEAPGGTSSSSRSSTTSNDTAREAADWRRRGMEGSLAASASPVLRGQRRNSLDAWASASAYV